MIHSDVPDILFDGIFSELRGLVSSIELVVKLDGLNPAGSIKLKTA
jgi:N-(2-amino-2-carboxyethyl)-L-glutamate synthase